jgi:uncharacterized protein YciI
MAKFALVATFDVDKLETQQEVRPGHRDYLNRLLDDGRLFGSGPWTDNTGALVIYEVADEAEARALFDADPFTTEGIWEVASLKEWNPITRSW